MTDLYYSVNNMIKLITVFQNFLTDKYNINADDLNINLKKEILNIMEKIKKNPLHTDMNLQELNKITLQTLRDIVKNDRIYNNQNKLLNKQNITNRDNELYVDRKNKYLDNTNINVNTLQNDNPERVLEDFKKLEEERKVITNTELERTNQIITDDNDQHISQEDFENKLALLQTHRDQLIENKDDNLSTTINDQDVREHFDNTLKNQLLLSTSEFIANRNALDSSQYQNINELDPKRIYAQSEAIHNIETNKIVNQPVNEIQPSFPLIKRDKSTLIEKLNEKYICINSIDRDWILQKNRYKYMVKFNYVHKTSKKIEIYENNSTIPNTKSALSSGIPNISGYYDDSNVFHNEFKPNEPLGNVIAYEYIEVLIDDNINVQTNFKNIYSIEITKVIIPVDIDGALSGRLHNFNLNHPYLLLQIDEFKDLYEGTSDAIRKSFCQLVYESTYKGINGRGYMVLKPVHNEKKIFQPSLLNSMPSITLSIITPNGTLLNDSTDGYSITKIEYEAFNKYYLKIVTGSHFDINEFFNGDRILIKKYNAYKVDITQDSTKLSALNSFINNENGHVIVKNGAANDNTYFRTFYIRAPGYFDNESGTYIVDEEILENLVIFNCEFDISNNPVNGFVLNMSLQNSISMKIVTKTNESTLFNQEMV